MYYLSSEATLTLAVFSVCSAMAVAASVYIRQQQHKRSKAQKDQQKIMETLQRAMANRAFFDLTLSDKDTAVNDYRCECIAVGEKTMVLQLGEENPVTSWAGKEVHIYFQLTTHTSLRYYDCTSTVQQVKKKEGVFLITLLLPTFLHNQQRRIFVRFELSESTLPNLNIWFGKASTASLHTVDTLSAEKHVSQTLHWTPLPAGQTRVKDVSAGGIQLLLARTNPLWGTLEKGHIFLLQTTLSETSYKAPITIVAMGVVTRIFPTSQAGICGAGIKFQHWAQVLDNTKPTWISLKKHEGILHLTSWIMRRQREQIRNLGQ